MPAGSETKPRVVIDTNVFVSGLTFRGKLTEVLDLAWQGETEVYISPFIFEELVVSLKKDFGWSQNEIINVLRRIKAKTILVHPRTTISAIREKEDDNRILECALEAGADYLISGDKKHLLPLKKYRGIKIVSPADFLRPA
jgi:putative PIN family toxin of toxin-antitoxin system